jgi:hypothetical protein
MRLERYRALGGGLAAVGAAAATLGAWLSLTAPDLRTDVQPVRGGFLFSYHGRL